MAILFVAGCGTQPAQPVVEACLREARAKLGDNPDAQIDEESLRAAVKQKPDGTWEVGGVVWFERGMENERQQSIVCQARDAADGKGTPEVTLLQFLWE